MKYFLAASVSVPHPETGRPWALLVEGGLQTADPEVGCMTDRADIWEVCDARTGQEIEAPEEFFLDKDLETIEQALLDSLKEYSR